MKKLLLAVTALALLAGPAVAQQDKSATQNKDPNAVYCEGKYLGADPDPAVRLQILRDYGCKGN